MRKSSSKIHVRSRGSALGVDPASLVNLPSCLEPPESAKLERMDKLLLLLQLLVTVYLTGLIWTIGVVHYPLFNMVDRANFAAFEAAHSARIGSVVLLPMLLELGLSVAMMLNPSSVAPNWAAWLGLGLTLLIWASTFLLQVPQHAALSSGFDQRAYETLVSTNWIRVLLWSARSGLLAWLVWAQLK